MSFPEWMIQTPAVLWLLHKQCSPLQYRQTFKKLFGLSPTPVPKSTAKNKQCYPSEGQSYVLHSLNSVQLHCVQLQLHEMPSTAPAMHLLLLLLLLLQQIQTSTRTSTIQTASCSQISG
jgi:hypothetical protein